MVKVKVDRNSCISCGVAPNLCSEVFELGEDNGKTRIVEKYSTETSEAFSVGNVPDNLHKCVREAAETCPVQAIVIEKTGE